MCHVITPTVRYSYHQVGNLEERQSRLLVSMINLNSIMYYILVEKLVSSVCIEKVLNGGLELLAVAHCIQLFVTDDQLSRWHGLGGARASKKTRKLWGPQAH